MEKIKLANPSRIFVLAGEQSGDLHGSLVIKHLKSQIPELKVDGIGGPMMKDAGMNCIHSSDELAVIGFVEVLKNIVHLYKILNDVEKYLREQKPDIVVLIDYPGFNARVAAIAKGLGIHVIYYICPQVWAWNSGRVDKITKLIDEAIVVFAFEVKIWQKAGATVNCYGHPLVGIAQSTTPKDKFKRDLEISNKTIISILPGSRAQEIYYILPILLDTAELILKEKPNTTFLLPIADTIDDERVLKYLKDRDIPIKLIRGKTYDSIAISDLCLVTSGTVTLETAIIGTPMLIVYRVNWLTSFISKFVLQAKHIGLPNVIANKRIVPEFIRDDFNPEKIATGAIEILNNKTRQIEIRENLAKVKTELGEPGAAKRVANHIYNRLQEIKNQ